MAVPRRADNSYNTGHRTTQHGCAHTALFTLLTQYESVITARTRGISILRRVRTSSKQHDDTEDDGGSGDHDGDGSGGRTVSYGPGGAGQRRRIHKATGQKRAERASARSHRSLLSGVALHAAATNISDAVAHLTRVVNHQMRASEAPASKNTKDNV